jgi:predicted kinase
MKDLFLIRGIPGSGKSTLAKLVCDHHIEADLYFIDQITGDYKFDASKLKQAHEWCKYRTESWLSAGYDVAVSNTFTQEWEMEAYYELAEKYGYRVHSIIVENRHNGLNQHGVPEEKLEQMKQRFEIKL